MLVVELIIVLLAIFLGARLGGIGIGFAGGLGVLVLAAIGVKPGNIPFDVISIIRFIRQKSCCAVTRNTSRSSHRS